MRMPPQPIEAEPLLDLAQFERNEWFPSCSAGPCQRGRMPCPSPVECRIRAPHLRVGSRHILDSQWPEPPETPREAIRWKRIGLAVMLTSAVAVIGAIYAVFVH